jgi:hypothetical protein
MHDAGKIMVGLLIFLAIVTSPMWYHWAIGGESDPPELRVVSESQSCVAPTPYMRAFHMDLLNDWRDESVRDGNRLYISFDGKEYDKSLSGTCIKSCHSNMDEFCDRCHEYVAVKPPCWSCHVEEGSGFVAGGDEENLGDQEGILSALGMSRYGS